MRASCGCAIVVVGLMMFPLMNSAFGGSFEDALSAANRGDYATANKLFRPLADGGDVVSQFNIGNSYANGHGVPKNEVEAIRWYRKAADRGYVNAQNRLGDVFYLSHRYAEAALWYTKAANQGFVESQIPLGLLFWGGQGVPKDYVAAMKWFGIAASTATDPTTDPTHRDRAVASYNGVAQEMTPQQIAQAQKLISEWKPVLDQGGGVEVSSEAGRDVYVKAASDECLKGQRSKPENAQLATGTLKAFCECTANALVKLITADEVASLAANKQPPSLQNKRLLVADQCRSSTLGVK